jgi:hypothetical protein
MQNLVISKVTAFRPMALVLMSLLLTGLAACGGTKVYTIDKTVVHQGNIYNLSNVQRIGSRIEGTMPDGGSIDMAGMDKKGLNAALDENEHLMVTTVIELDDRDMVYERRRVEKYSDYSKMVKDFESAQKKISKFMADKKKTQLKLS